LNEEDYPPCLQFDDGTGILFEGNFLGAKETANSAVLWKFSSGPTT
jgi:hypothetical protein